MKDKRHGIQTGIGSVSVVDLRDQLHSHTALVPGIDSIAECDKARVGFGTHQGD